MRSTFFGIGLLVAGAVGLNFSGVRAEPQVSAYDPALHASPPTRKGHDESHGSLPVDADFLARARAFQANNPGIVRQQGGMGQVGEVIVIEGSEQTVQFEGVNFAPRMDAIARKVIEKYGDNFESITVWLTFNDAASRDAGAYALPTRFDVRGLGRPIMDRSAQFGSRGALRTISNMKRNWRFVTDDAEQGWSLLMETWGQESGHRWMMYLQFRDRRTGQLSDALLGRDCAHYSRFVETQGSVHDGLAWTDNGNGTFSASTERSSRYSALDLYGMGLLGPDEVPPFFLIDDIPGYTRAPCAMYWDRPRPIDETIQGTRVDISIDDIIAANGPRVPAAGELLDGKRQDYFRDAQVVLTRPSEVASDSIPTSVAQLIDGARLRWEEWMRQATGNRMVVCTQVSSDCGDPRSDVVALRFNEAKKAPQAGPLRLELVVTNSGTRDATGVTATLAASLGAAAPLSAPVGVVKAGAEVTVPFDLDLRTVACGTAFDVKAQTQSDHHASRLRRSLIVGAESVVVDSFEEDAGWTVNPDATDNSGGALWERGTPVRTEIVVGSVVQPDGAHGGQTAWVTGAAASGPGQTFVHSGRTTLESPTLDGSTWREPKLRYWVAFAGMRASSVTTGVEPSPESRLIVLAKALPHTGDAGSGGDGDAGAGRGSDWIEIDRLENVIEPNWTHRTVALPEALVGGPVKLRFVAEDANPQAGGVEAALDDLEITSNLPACYEPYVAEGGDGGGGCSCSLADRANSPVFWGPLAFLLGVGVWRRGRWRRR